MMARFLVAYFGIAAAVACSSSPQPPVATPPPITSDTATVAATPPSAAPSGSTRHCFQRVMCVKDSHFDTTQCRCVPDGADGGAP